MVIASMVLARSLSIGTVLNIGICILIILLTSAPSYRICGGTSTSVGDILTTGDSLVISNSALTMEADCNLVLSISGHSIWDTNTAGKGDGHFQLKLNSNGELIIFSGAGTTVWTNSVNGSDSNYVLEFDGDGNIQVLNNGHGVWSNCPTNSCIH